MKSTVTANGSRQAAPPQPPLTPGAPETPAQPQSQAPTQAQQLANIALAFLRRTTFQGEELDTLAEVRGWLMAIARGQVLAVHVPQQDNGGPQ